MFLLYAYIFIVGAAIGSFLNVVIARVPEGQSILRPRSRCPDCKTPIRARDNIPLLSFVLLRGRCRQCGRRISLRYPLVEALNGTIYVLLFLQFGIQFKSFVYAAFVSALVAITFIDIDHQIIPDVISLPGAMAALLLPAGLRVFGWSGIWPLSMLDALIGLLVGGLPLALFALAYYLFTRTEGLGIGDMKLLAWTGALLGWQSVLMTIFLGSVLGTLVSVPLLIIGKKNGKTAIPFGPFLSAGAVISLLYGRELAKWWFVFGTNLIGG
ncbi:prepilin peptidase [bacterium]|nr:prepilin peptidase [candidate division CSSED10-310 bacterium]